MEEEELFCCENCCLPIDYDDDMSDMCEDCTKQSLH